MGEEIVEITMEARKERVLQALHILTGDGIPLITEEEQAIIREIAAIALEYRDVREFGYGRIEAVVVGHRLEGVNPTFHKKRKDLISSPQTT